MGSPESRSGAGRSPASVLDGRKLGPYGPEVDDPDGYPATDQHFWPNADR